MLLQHQSSRPTASPTHGRIPFFHVRPPCDTDLSNIKKDVPALRSRSKNKGRASPVPHKPTTRYPGHAHSHVRLHLDNSSILHHQRYLGQPFDSASHRHVHHLFPTSDPTQHLELHWPCSLKMITGQPTTSCSKFETVRKRREGGMGIGKFHTWNWRMDGKQTLQSARKG
jgi:hypothetical protein